MSLVVQLLGGKEMMKNNIRLYGLLSMIFLVSLGLALFLPTTEMLKGIYGLPAVGSLFTALWTIYRDDVAHRRQLEIENQKKFFNLSVTSHMAEVAFDRHVSFCEEYVKRILQSPISSKDKTSMYESFSEELKQIRNAHALWISPKINDELSACEEVWRKFGVASRIAQETYGELRDTYNGKARELLEVIHGQGEYPVNLTLIEKQIKIIQDILGINELTKFRADLVHQAAKTLDLQALRKR